MEAPSYFAPGGRQACASGYRQGATAAQVATEKQRADDVTHAVDPRHYDDQAAVGHAGLTDKAIGAAVVAIRVPISRVGALAHVIIIQMAYPAPGVPTCAQTQTLASMAVKLSIGEWPLQANASSPADLNGIDDDLFDLGHRSTSILLPAAASGGPRRPVRQPLPGNAHLPRDRDIKVIHVAKRSVKGVKVVLLQTQRRGHGASLSAIAGLLKRITVGSATAWSVRGGCQNPRPPYG